MVNDLHAPMAGVPPIQEFPKHPIWANPEIQGPGKSPRSSELLEKSRARNKMVLTHLSTFADQIMSLEEENRKSRSCEETLRAEIKRLLIREETLQAANTRLRYAQEELTADNIALRSREEILQAENAKLRTTQEELKAEIVRCENRINGMISRSERSKPWTWFQSVAQRAPSENIFRNNSLEEAWGVQAAQQSIGDDVRESNGLLRKGAQKSAEADSTSDLPIASDAVAGGMMGSVGGAAVGTASGMVAGLGAAAFTFGLSVPVGAAVGGALGAVSGATVGTLSGTVRGSLRVCAQKVNTAFNVEGNAFEVEDATVEDEECDSDVWQHDFIC